MTNAFTIPKVSTILSTPKARLTFVSKVKARPKKMVSIALPGSSDGVQPKMQRKPK